MTPEEIVGFIVTPNKEAFKAATIANLVLKQPTFSANWFKRQKQKLVQQSIGRNKVVLGIGWSLSREIMMPNHSYKNYYSLLPLAELKSFELETIKKWHQTAFATDGVTIVATGTTDVQQLGEAIDKALEGLPTKQAKFVHRTLKINVPGKVVIFHAPKASKSMILTFGKAPAAKARQDVYLNTALGVLGYGKRSRLFKAVRTGLRASYGFRAGYIDYTRNQRLFHMSGEVETSKLQAGLDTVRQTYNEFRKDGIGFIEFPFARRYYRQRIEASLLKPRDAAYLLMNGRMNGASLNDFTSLSTQIDNMSRDQVNKFIKKEFAPFNQLLTIIVTPNATAVKGDCIITAYDQWKSCF
ncbi:MAG: insulinase family protein [Rhizobiaceae bacterium]